MSGETVLVVDDEPFMREILQEVLSAISLHVEQAQSVGVARQMIQRSMPDLIISDIKMPNESGVELLRWIRQKELKIPFIIMTGYIDAELTAEALNLGASSFLGKPIRGSALCESVESALSTVRMAQREEEYKRSLRSQLDSLRQEYIDEIIQHQKLFAATLMSFANAIDARDRYTHMHSANVAEYSVVVGRQLGASRDFLEMLDMAGHLHDIGKIGIPEHILLKPGRLTEDEYDVLKGHPEMGAKILAPLPAMEDVITAVRYHHERFDGTGYPKGLRGGEIPLAARIISVCDAFDAMTTDRPYRKALSPVSALKILNNERGGQFDSGIVDAIVKAFQTSEKYAPMFSVAE